MGERPAEPGDRPDRLRIGVAVVPYLSTARLVDLARETLESVVSDQHELSFVAYSNHPLTDDALQMLERFGPVYDNDVNCLSRGWNRGIDRLLREGCDYVFCPNLDIVLAPDALDLLVRGAEQEPDRMVWTMSPWLPASDLPRAPRSDSWLPYPHFSAFMVGHEAWNIIGPFDEAFEGAYNEDLDYHWRASLKGANPAQYEAARFFHHGSATIQADHKLRGFIEVQHPANDRYFKKKWKSKPATCCDQPYADLYRHPFDDPAQDGFEARTYPPTW